MKESTFEKIVRKTGRKPVSCKCDLCKSQCMGTPCLGTPEDIIRVIAAGFADRLAITVWKAGMVMKVIDKPVEMIQARYDKEKRSCTFFTNGLCELHELGLKPTEGKLSHHSTSLDNFNPKKSISWNVAKTWIEIKEEEVKRLSNILNKELTEVK